MSCSIVFSNDFLCFSFISNFHNRKFDVSENRFALFYFCFTRRQILSQTLIYFPFSCSKGYRSDINFSQTRLITLRKSTRGYRWSALSWKSCEKDRLRAKQYRIYIYIKSDMKLWKIISTYLKYHIRPLYSSLSHTCTCKCTS